MKKVERNNRNQSAPILTTGFICFLQNSRPLYAIVFAIVRFQLLPSFQPKYEAWLANFHGLSQYLETVPIKYLTSTKLSNIISAKRFSSIVALTHEHAGWEQAVGLVTHGAQSGQVPCSGTRSQDKAPDVVSATIHGDEVAVNALLRGGAVFCAIPCSRMLAD